MTTEITNVRDNFFINMISFPLRSSRQCSHCCRLAWLREKYFLYSSSKGLLGLRTPIFCVKSLLRTVRNTNTTLELCWWIFEFFIDREKNVSVAVPSMSVALETKFIGALTCLWNPEKFKNIRRDVSFYFES